MVRNKSQFDFIGKFSKNGIFLGETIGNFELVKKVNCENMLANLGVILKLIRGLSKFLQGFGSLLANTSNAVMSHCWWKEMFKGIKEIVEKCQVHKQFSITP